MELKIGMYTLCALLALKASFYLNTTAGVTNTGVNVWNTVDSTKINVRG